MRMPACRAQARRVMRRLDSEMRHVVGDDAAVLDDPEFVSALFAGVLADKVGCHPRLCSQLSALCSAALCCQLCAQRSVLLGGGRGTGWAIGAACRRVGMVGTGSERGQRNVQHLPQQLAQQVFQQLCSNSRNNPCSNS
eukprot:267335-Chlamydomonas_euryale.AAC.2